MQEAQTRDHSRTRPVSSRFHLFGYDDETALLDVESGWVQYIPAAHADLISIQLTSGDIARAEITAAGLGFLKASPPERGVPQSVPLKALSLSIAQKCNLGCTYCYAEQGGFGGKMVDMPQSVVRQSVDQLFEDIVPGDRVTLGFMGGEPLASRKALHDAAHYAAAKATEKNAAIGFSLTTNATLLRDEDIALFQKYHFTLNVSLDGLGGTNDALRPFRSGKGTFAIVAKNIERLLATPDRRFVVGARATITPYNIDLCTTLNGLIEMGLDSVMFSPMLSAPNGKAEMEASDFETFLDQLRLCGELFEEQLTHQRVLPFTNVISMLRRIHTYRRDEYPCGAGGGYMSVSAKGELYACHRFVNDEVGLMGNVRDGVDPLLQRDWLEERNLRQQSPCQTCWARYLCSGSCHYEVINRGRPACDYIRGWADYCLGLYARMTRHHPELLERILLTGPHE